VTTTILTRTIARLLLLPIFMTSIAVLVKGYIGPGDGFSAGVIAAIGVLIQYVAFGYREAEAALPVRYSRVLALLGLFIALLVVFVPTLLGQPMLTHYPRPGEEVIKLGSLELLTAVVFDVGVYFLVVGFTVGAIGSVAHTLEERGG
jgi:multisubunit Na+/H+ antiporter MnhB subunit